MTRFLSAAVVGVAAVDDNVLIQMEIQRSGLQDNPYEMEIQRSGLQDNPYDMGLDFGFMNMGDDLDYFGTNMFDLGDLEHDYRLQQDRSFKEMIEQCYHYCKTSKDGEMCAHCSEEMIEPCYQNCKTSKDGEMCAQQCIEMKPDEEKLQQKYIIHHPGAMGLDFGFMNMGDDLDYFGTNMFDLEQKHDDLLQQDRGEQCHQVCKTSKDGEDFEMCAKKCQQCYQYCKTSKDGEDFEMCANQCFEMKHDDVKADDKKKRHDSFM